MIKRSEERRVAERIEHHAIRVPHACMLGCGVPPCLGMVDHTTVGEAQRPVQFAARLETDVWLEGREER